MGNQPSSPQRSLRRRSRSRSPTGKITSHRALKHKTKSLELPDLNPTCVTPSQTQPIPIAALKSSLQRTDSAAQRLVGGQYEIHSRVDPTGAAMSMAEVKHSQPQDEIDDQTQTYRAPPVVVHHQQFRQQQQNNGDLFHSGLHVGFERHPAEPKDVTVISPSEVASGLVAPATRLQSRAPSSRIFTSVEIKWTGIAEDVILSLYSASVGGLGVADIIKADDDSDGHGLHHMERVAFVSLLFVLEVR